LAEEKEKREEKEKEKRELKLKRKREHDEKRAAKKARKTDRKSADKSKTTKDYEKLAKCHKMVSVNLGGLHSSLPLPTSPAPSSDCKALLCLTIRDIVRKLHVLSCRARLLFGVFLRMVLDMEPGPEQDTALKFISDSTATLFQILLKISTSRIYTSKDHQAPLIQSLLRHAFLIFFFLFLPGGLCCA
jgi:hypothetical protein